MFSPAALASLEDFNPRTPRGVRRQAILAGGSTAEFQSTHPARGATAQQDDALLDMYISIHAPREGCDQDMPKDYRQVIISIHAPREGCDGELVPVDAFHNISIHAPREGCDMPWALMQIWPRNFNPRTPRGVRHTYHVAFHKM